LTSKNYNVIPEIVKHTLSLLIKYGADRTVYKEYRNNIREKEVDFFSSTGFNRFLDPEM